MPKETEASQDSNSIEFRAPRLWWKNVLAPYRWTKKVEGRKPIDYKSREWPSPRVVHNLDTRLKEAISKGETIVFVNSHNHQILLPCQSLYITHNYPYHFLVYPNHTVQALGGEIGASLTTSEKGLLLFEVKVGNNYLVTSAKYGESIPHLYSISPPSEATLLMGENRRGRLQYLKKSA